jgi:multisubunit Na+/H+ antiporter MnhB subunit
MLTASSIAPVGFTYAWVAYLQDQKGVAVAAGCIGLLAVTACLLVLGYARKNVEAMEFKAQSIEAADRENLGFMLLYLLPLFTDKIATLNWSVWIPMVLVFAVIIATGYAYHFNPLLGIMQWHFYKITSIEGVTYVLITKKQLRTAAKSLAVGQLTEYILIDLGDDK